ncbi:PAS factor family protein [Vibrio sp. CAU 1672]|uniref:PAS factor family protein n=1 Tax=Vibrio sp. CAU 1672 TaxID=3032594 RepID=UPI0023DA8E65|nr:PAS factor family protein [Vibrio sp. CAU 1672]MDF2152114.1 PAS factor family protein [Vibrio sp. CAU 1672]
MNATTTLIYDTLQNLASQEPEQHAKIRQNLYDHLDLPFDKQLALYTSVLAPVGSGKIEDNQGISNAVDTAIKILETPER